MKIVHIVAGKANPDRMNGVNKVVHQISTVMHAMGLNVIVTGITGTPGPVSRDYPVMLFQGNVRSFNMDGSLKRFLEDLPTETIVHFHGALLPLFWRMARFLKKRGVRYVVTPHGALMPQSMKRNAVIKRVYYHLFEKSFLSSATRLHAISHEEYDILGLRYTVGHIPNGYPVKDDISVSAKSGDLVFGYIGRLDKEHKGLDALLEGFHHFYQENRTGFLWLIGDGPDRKDLENQALQYGLQGRIVFHGEHHGKKKEVLLSDMMVFVHPSRWDVLPTAILEAASWHKPLLLTRATGFAQAVETWQSGYMIESADPIMISHGMNEMLQAYKNDSLNSMGNNAARMVKTDYNWQNLVQEGYLPLYKAVMK